MILRNPEVRIETSALCNASCVICPRDKMTRPKVVMPLEHFMYLVDQAKALGAQTVSLFGHGEPLTDKVLEEKIEYCREKGVQTFITSNAGLLTPRRTKRILDSGLNHIRFSVHGFEDNYEKVHRGLKWDYVIDQIEWFIRYKGDCKVSISVIPMHGETVEDIRDFWESKDIDFLEVWKPHNWAYGKSYRFLKTFKRKTTCGRPANGPIQIQADGKMIVCCYDFDGRMVVGDTYWEDIETILKGAAFDVIRERHNNGDLSGLICGKCDQLNIEDESPLLYSSRDETRTVGKTSSTKFNMEA
jgi:molybdenum cofactor biosynthesis enzyme MoaA